MEDRFCFVGLCIFAIIVVVLALLSLVICNITIL